MSFDASRILKSLIARGLVEVGTTKINLMVDIDKNLVELSQTGSHIDGALGAALADSVARGLSKPDRAELDKKMADSKVARKAARRAEQAKDKAQEVEAAETAKVAASEAKAAAKDKPTEPERQHSALRPGGK